MHPPKQRLRSDTGARHEIDPRLVDQAQLIGGFERERKILQQLEPPPMRRIVGRRVDAGPHTRRAGILCRTKGCPEHIARMRRTQIERRDPASQPVHELRVHSVAEHIQLGFQHADIGRRFRTFGRQERKLGQRHMVDLAVRSTAGAQRLRGFVHEIIEVTRSHDAGGAVEPLGTSEIDQDQQAAFALSLVMPQVGQIFEKLVAIGQPTAGIHPAEGMLQLDLSHDHGRQVGQRTDLVGRGLAWFGSENAHRSEAETIAGHQRGAGVEANAGFRERTIEVATIGQKVGQHQRIRSVGHLRARCFIPRDRHLVDADARLEPLPILVGQ